MKYYIKFIKLIVDNTQIMNILFSQTERFELNQRRKAMKSQTYTGAFSWTLLLPVFSMLFMALPAIAAERPRPALEASAQVLEKVNLNLADATELQKIRGIGPSFAERILEYRKEHGRFQSPDELINVRGIGPAKYERIKDQVTI